MKKSIIASLVFSAATAHAATVSATVNIGVPAGTNASLFDGNGTDTEIFTLAGLTATHGGNTVTFDLEFQLRGGNGNYFSNFSQVGTTDEFLLIDQVQDILTLVVKNVSAGATFDGFTSFGAFSNTNGDSQVVYTVDAGAPQYNFTANGTTYATPQTFLVAGSPSHVLGFRAPSTGSNGFSQLGVQFTTVPELSTAGLIGLGSLMVAFRRKRA